MDQWFTARFRTISVGHWGFLNVEDVTDRLLNVDQLSEIIGVKPATIYGWVHEGTIPHYKINRLVRFSKPQISSWLKQKQKNGTRKSARITLRRY